MHAQIIKLSKLHAVYSKNTAIVVSFDKPGHMSSYDNGQADVLSVNNLISFVLCSLYLLHCIYSLLCGMTIFCNVFSFEYYKGSSITEIVDVLKTNGPFNTGITFIQ